MVKDAETSCLWQDCEGTWSRLHLLTPGWRLHPVAMTTRQPPAMTGKLRLALLRVPRERCYTKYIKFSAALNHSHWADTLGTCCCLWITQMSSYREHYSFMSAQLGGSGMRRGCPALLMHLCRSSRRIQTLPRHTVALLNFSPSNINFHRKPESSCVCVERMIQPNNADAAALQLLEAEHLLELTREAAVQSHTWDLRARTWLNKCGDDATAPSRSRRDCSWNMHAHAETSGVPSSVCANVGSISRAAERTRRFGPFSLDPLRQAGMKSWKRAGDRRWSTPTAGSAAERRGRIRAFIRAAHLHRLLYFLRQTQQVDHHLWEEDLKTLKNSHSQHHEHENTKKHSNKIHKTRTCCSNMIMLLLLIIFMC